MKSPLRSVRHRHTARRLMIVVAAGLAIAMFAGASVTQAAPADPGSTSTSQAVSIASFAFAPAEVSVPQGATVTWTNAQDAVQHTTTSLDGVWDSGALATSDSFGFTFNQPGDFTYQCSIHPSMQGIIHVVSSTDAQALIDQSVDAPAQVGAAAPATAAPLAVTPTATPSSSYHY